MLEQWFLLHRSVKSPYILHVLTYASTEADEAIPFYDELKKKIIKYKKFLEDEMKQYSLNELMYKSNRIEDRIGVLKSEVDMSLERTKEDLYENLKAVKRDIITNNKTSKRAVEAKVTMLVNKVDILEDKLAGLESKLDLIINHLNK